MAWRWLRRMKSALYLLGVLGLASLLATVVPQRPNVPDVAAAWIAGTEGPGTIVGQFLDLIDAYDVYGSAWFLLLLTLLFTSLTACLVPRYRAWWRVALRSQPPRSRNLTVHPERAQVVTSLPADEALAAARGVLADRRWRLRVEDDGGPGDQVAAERGHVLREAGSLAFHTSFYVLLVGIVLGQLHGFRGQVGIVEGEAWTDTQVAYWSYTPGRLWEPADHRAFELTLDRFDIDWYPDEQPKLFSSEVTISEADGDTYTDSVAGNDPLVVDGMKIHQLDWGYAPRVIVEVDGEVVHDAFLPLNSLNAAGRPPWFGVAKAPAADPDVGLELLLAPSSADDGNGGRVAVPSARQDTPILAITEFRGDLRLTRAQNVNRLDKTALQEVETTLISVGQGVRFSDGVVVQFPEVRRWVGFQISHRPTAPLLLAGAFLVLAGLVPALYAYRRRVWVAADRVGATTTLTIAGRAFQRPEAFEDEHCDLVHRIAGATGGQVLDDLGGDVDPPDPDGADRVDGPRPDPPTEVVRT